MAKAGDCRLWLQDEPELQANPDIAGIGVIIAFLISACTSFILLISAYWFGALKSDHLSWADVKCFRGKYHRHESEWKHALNRVAFIISDQQLITGLSILIAGFYELFAKDLDVYHWNIVVYLAYMSSTIHLITLTLLQDVLRQNSTLRNLRLFGMLLLLALLVVALVPSVAGGSTGFWNSPGLPARCLFDQNNAKKYYDEYLSENLDTPLTYALLSASYIWRFSSLFTGRISSKPRLWLRLWLHAKPESAFEHILKKILIYRQSSPIPGFLLYHILKPIYILFKEVVETVQSFMMTIMILLFTLIWGVVHIIRPRIEVLAEHPLPSEWQMSFGQILPLLLLAQPLAAIVEHCATRKSRSLPISMPCVLSATKAMDPVFDVPSGHSPSRTLADALRDNDLLTAKEKVDRNCRDPITAHLFRSRAFKGLLWSFLFAELGVTIAMIGIGSVGFSVIVIYYFFIGFLFWMPACYLIAIICSRKLR